MASAKQCSALTARIRPNLHPPALHLGRAAARLRLIGASGSNRVCYASGNRKAVGQANCTSRTKQDVGLLTEKKMVRKKKKRTTAMKRNHRRREEQLELDLATPHAPSVNPATPDLSVADRIPPSGEAQTKRLRAGVLVQQMLK